MKLHESPSPGPCNTSRKVFHNVARAAVAAASDPHRPARLGERPLAAAVGHFAEVPDVGGGDRGGAGGETLRIVLVAADAAQRDPRHAGGCRPLGDQVEIVAAGGAVAPDALEPDLARPR